jgi:CMP/dCMP kinase
MTITTPLLENDSRRGTNLPQLSICSRVRTARISNVEVSTVQERRSPVMIVTIDGPAGTGKSTVAKMLADRLGFAYLNTGAMYRAVAWACLQQQIEPTSAAQVAGLAEQLQIEYRQLRLWLDGVDVSDQIRSPEVTAAASLVAQNPAVRRRLVQLQRQIGTSTDLVTEGRDQGTVVFPTAQCKFFLTATPEVRAQRRYEELIEAGQSPSRDEILADQLARDARDESRAVAPLRPADDAVLIDSSQLTVDAVLALMEHRVRNQAR